MLRRYLFAMVMGMWSLTSGAATVENLLQVNVPVADQGAELREEAFREGLGTVVVRLTGRPGIRQSAVLEQLRDDAARYVQRFQYAAAGEGLRLEITYYGESLRRALVDAGKPIWEAGRPPVLVWLAVERSNGRVIVGADQAGETRRALDQAALAFGVPLQFPKLDAADRDRVSSSDIWGGFTDPIARASERYNTPLVWVGRLEQSGNGWRARWRLLADGGRSAWSTNGADAAAVFRGAAAELASRLVGQYAVLPDLAAGRTLRLHVRDVDSAARYARLEQHLSELGGVVGVELTAVEGSEASYELRLEVDVERVVRDLERSRLLVPVTTSLDTPPEAGRNSRRALGEGERLYRLAP